MFQEHKLGSSLSVSALMEISGLWKCVMTSEKVTRLKRFIRKFSNIYSPKEWSSSKNRSRGAPNNINIKS